MALGPIPYDSIRNYARDKGLEEDVADAFEMIISEMDGTFLKWHSDEAEAQRKSKEKS